MAGSSERRGFGTKRLRGFLHLSWTDRFVLLQAALLVGVVTLGLRVTTFRALQRLLDRRAGPPRPRPAEADEAIRDKVVWAVRVGSRFIPGATCLPQTLAVQALLRRRGYSVPTRIRIGVAKRDQGELAAHAWVENHEQIVIYDPEDHSQYTSLPPLDSIDGSQPPGLGG